MNSLFIGLLYYCLLISSSGKKEKEKLHVSGNKKPAVSGNIIKEVLYKTYSFYSVFISRGSWKLICDNSSLYIQNNYQHNQLLVLSKVNNGFVFYTNNSSVLRYP